MNGSLAQHDLVVGLWRLLDRDLDAAALARWTHGVLDLGISAFDLADIYGDYGCEERFGSALELEPGLRDRLLLVTKCDIKLVSDRRPDHRRHVYDTSREHIARSVEASLRALRTDRLDVLLLHRPDPLLDPQEVARAFDELHEAGKVLAFGVSNFRPSQLSMLAWHVRQPLVTNQVELSVLHLDPFQDGTLDQCLERGLRPMAWSPLAGGVLPRGETEQARRVRERLVHVGRDHGVSPETVALAFLLRHPSRPQPILGSGRLERLAEARSALDLELTRDEWFELWCASTGKPLP